MSDAAVLKEFLVELGWKNDETQQRRFNDAITSVTKGVTVMATAVVAAEVALVGIAQRVARSFEALSYASSRVNASARNIASFRYAISQLGGTAEGAMASLEAFSRKLRESPGQEAMLKGWGVRTRDAQGRLRDSTELMKEFLQSRKFLAQPEFTRLHLAESMGIDERTYRAMLGDVERFTAEYQAKMRKAGLDPDTAAANAKKFQQAWRSMLSSIEVLVDRVAMAHGEKIAKLIDKFTAFVDKHGPRIASFFESIIGFVLRAADAIGDLVTGFAEFVSKADPIVKKLTGIEGAFEAIAIVLLARLIPGVSTLTALLTGLVGGAAWRSFVAVLSALGLGGGALAMGGAALGFGIGMTPGSAGAGENEFERQERIKRDPDYYKREQQQKGGSLWERGKRWWNKNAPSWMGVGPAEARETEGGQPGGDTAGASSLRELIINEAKAAGIDPRIMFGIHAGESGHGSKYDKKHDAIESSWGPFQLNRRRGLGAEFERDTGLDVRDPSTIPAQARWVARYIAKHGRRGVTSNWFGYHGDRDWNPKWGSAGYNPAKPTAALQGSGMTMADLQRYEAEAAAKRKAFADRVRAGGSIAEPMPAGPIGGSNSFVHNIAHGHTLHSKTTINVNAAGDPGATARSIAGVQKRVNTDLLRNMQGAAH